MLYFSSDLHFDDNRDFQLRIILRNNVNDGWTKEQNNEFIIENYNKIVKPEDTVVIVGDVSITKEGYEHVRKLNGKKILVKGNYDDLHDDEFLLEYFDEVHENLYFKDDNVFVTHKPTDYRKSAFNIVGHVHSLFRIQENMVNVSLEAWEYQPISLDLILQLRDNMKKGYYDDNVYIGKLLYKGLNK